MRLALPSTRAVRSFWSLWTLFFFAATASAQTTVTGTVTADDGEALIGATVVVTGTPGVGTVTDIDGNYALPVPATAESLTYSYTGYGRQVVALNGRSRVDVTLSTDANLLKDIVVVGYGTVAKKNLSGSVDQISEKRIENIPVTSFDQVLAGQVQGVQFRQGTGQPGAGAEILIRGIGSLTGDGNAPLIVIDGTPYGNYNAQTNNFLSLVNPNDIATITVVRDAAEKAIYGSRAAAGLILITTKRGRGEEPRISFNTYYGIQTIPEYEKPDVLNATELAQFLQDRFVDLEKAKGNDNPTIPDNLANPSEYGVGTNWFDLVSRNAPMTNADVSVRGGTEKTSYALSLGYQKQDGVLVESDFTRYSARLNFDVDATPWLKLSMDLAPSWTNTNNTNTDAGAGQFSAYNTTTTVRWADPSAPAFDANGNPTQSTQGKLLPFYTGNPLFNLRNEYTIRNNRQILSNVRATAQLPYTMYARTSLGGNLRFNNIRSFSPSAVLGGALTPRLDDPNFARSSASSGRSEEQRLIWESAIGIARRFGASDQHNIDAFVGYSTEFTTQLTFTGSAGRLIEEQFEYLNSGNTYNFELTDVNRTPRAFFGTSENIVERALISYLGRIRYDFRDRYFATIAVRTDGSSRFGPNRRFATFPSASLAWDIAAEDWFDIGAISRLRVEGSAGLSGNNTVADYRYQGNVGGGAYVFGNNQVISRSLNTVPNPDLGWEESEQLDIGIQLGLFKDRLGIKATYYDQTTTGLLFNAPLPTISGFGGVFANLGSLQNRGVEFAVDARIVERNKLVWSVDANLSANRNKVLRLGAGEDPTLFAANSGTSVPMSYTRIGDQIGQFYGLQLTGLYTPEMIADSDVLKYPGAVVGAPIFVDGNGDGVLQRGVGDRSDLVKIGNPWPDFTFGLNTNLSYDMFSLQITSLGEVGSEILDLVRELTYNTEGAFNVDRAVLNNYRVGSEDYSLRAPTFVGVASNIYRTRSSTNVVSGTYWKINNITLAYNLAKFSDRASWWNGGRVYASVQNALVFSKFDGNPQIQRSDSGPLERNVRYGAYPVARTYTIGTTLNF